MDKIPSSFIERGNVFIYVFMYCKITYLEHLELLRIPVFLLCL